MNEERVKRIVVAMHERIQRGGPSNYLDFDYLSREDSAFVAAAVREALVREPRERRD